VNFVADLAELTVEKPASAAELHGNLPDSTPPGHPARTESYAILAFERCEE
jgi:hypothetical protein